MAASFLTLPEYYKLVHLLAPAADAAGRASGYISLKNAKAAWLVAYINQGNAATVLLTVNQARDVAGTGGTPITVAVPIWANQDCGTSDTLVAQTKAVNFTTSAATTIKQIVFQIDPATFNINAADPFDCINIVTGASNAANITSAFILLESRYPQATPPTARTD